jgi:hypothetical protein
MTLQQLTSSSSSELAQLLHGVSAFPGGEFLQALLVGGEFLVSSVLCIVLVLVVDFSLVDFSLFFGDSAVTTSSGTGELM